MSIAHKLLFLLGVTMFVREAHGRQCPDGCHCHSSAEDMTVAVYCTSGRLTSIPVEKIDHSTHVIVISSPFENISNHITIGKVLVQPVPYFSLEELHIVRSNIISIGQHSFWGLVELTILNLTDNKIESISDDNFRGLVNLKSLYLDNNCIKNIRSESFIHLTDLQKLSLSHNNITLLPPRVFRMLGKLISLDISSNNLTDLIPEVFKDIQNLKTFKCRKCNLKMINTQIYHLLSDLQILDLGGNQFKYLMADEFISLKKLKVLKLDGNQLPVILDYSFRMQTSLNTLSLERNRLVMLTPDAFINLIHLEKLDISYNKLDKLQIQTFTPIGDSLRELDISGNNIHLEYLTAILELLPVLRQLKIANMSLTNLPEDIFLANPFLNSLSLSENRLNDFPYKMLSHMRYIQSFDMSKNKLQAIDANALYRLEKIAQVNIDENPWHCVRCKIKYMIEFMQSTILNDTLKRLKCTTPMSMRGIHFSLLSQQKIDECDGGTFGNGILSGDSKMSIAATILLGLFVMVLVMATCFCCSKRYTPDYYTEEEKDNSNEVHANHYPKEARTELSSTDIDIALSQTQFTEHLELNSYGLNKMTNLVATIHAPYQMNTAER